MGLSYTGRMRADIPGEILATSGLLLPNQLQHVSMESLQSSIAGVGVLIPLSGRTDGRPIRLDLWASARGADNQTIVEQLYILRRTELPGYEILLERACTISWVRGTYAVSGGPADHFWCDTAVISTAGLMQAKVRAEVEKQDLVDGMATVTLFDSGPAIGILRNMIRLTASAAMPYSALWS